MSIYYVYAYLRKSDGTPYYIGKGCGYRAFNKKHGKVSVPKDRTKIVFLETNLSEIGAFALERRYIRWYGRKDLGNGILLNLTDGGEGASGRKGSDKQREAVSGAWSGVKRGPQSEDHKRHMVESKRQKGVLGHTDQTRQKMSQTRKTMKWIHNKALNAQTRVQESECDKYIMDGWEMGRLYAANQHTK